MGLLKPKQAQITVRHVQTDAELEAAQRLRYEVFFEEFGATPLNDKSRQSRLDIDEYDEYADHLIVIETDTANGDDTIIGTYRLIKQLENIAVFNAGKEYDLSPILNSGETILELSRSCVLPEHRTRYVLKLLWQGIADYINDNKIDIMFGCASFHTINPTDIAHELSYLHHYHLAPDAVRCKALDDLYVDMNMMPKDNVNVRKAFHALPPLLKGYLRVGSSVGHGAVIDHQFGTTDVFVIMQTHMLTEKYKKHYDVDTSASKTIDILAENSEDAGK